MQYFTVPNLFNWNSSEFLGNIGILKTSLESSLLQYKINDMGTSGNFDADLFYLMYTYFYLKLKISKIKQISNKEIFLKNKVICLVNSDNERDLNLLNSQAGFCWSPAS